MNKVITSKEQILKECLDLAIENGLQSINIRGVAQACGVSVGSVYNYFPSKTDLVIATIEEVWKDIIPLNGNLDNQNNFSSQVRWIFESIKDGASKYPTFFTLHSVSIANEDKAKGQMIMDNYFCHIKSSLKRNLEIDKKIRSDVFTLDFTKDKFIEFIFNNMITLLFLKKQRSCDTLIDVIEKIIY